MSNFEIYCPLFYEAIHTIFKIFAQHGLSVGRDCFKNNRVFEFLARLPQRF